MNKYELVMIVDAANSQEEKESIVKDAMDTISKCDGKVINHHVWLEKHKFSFPIRKRWEGTYYILNFEGATGAMSKLRQLLKLNDKIVRSLLIRV